MGGGGSTWVGVVRSGSTWVGMVRSVKIEQNGAEFPVYRPWEACRYVI